MNSPLKQEGDTVTLCCIYPFNPCCPTIKKDSGNFIIKDDWSDEIILSESGLNEVIQKINETISLSGDSMDS